MIVPFIFGKDTIVGCERDVYVGHKGCETAAVADDGVVTQSDIFRHIYHRVGKTAGDKMGGGERGEN